MGRIGPGITIGIDVRRGSSMPTTQETLPDTLWAIERMTGDPDLQGRIRASIAKESSAGSIPVQSDPVGAAAQYRYEIASAPGWGGKYQYALDSDHPNPGRDTAVISDAEITSQVQATFIVS